VLFLSISSTPVGGIHAATGVERGCRVTSPMAFRRGGH
jgi:hypothetical protein